MDHTSEINKICYDLCVFCQKTTKQQLKYPRNLKIPEHVEASYDSTNDILRLYQSQGKLTEYGHLNIMNEWASDFKK